MTLQAKTARVERDGSEVELPSKQVTLGDVIVVRPGVRIPIPVEKTEGAKVGGGTINTTGAFRFRAEKVGSETVLAQIVRMVEAAQGARLPIQALVDKVAGWIVPAVIAVARVQRRLVEATGNRVHLLGGLLGSI